MKNKVPDGLSQWIEDIKRSSNDNNFPWHLEKIHLLDKLISVYITDEEDECSCQKVYEQNLRLKTWIRAISRSDSSFLIDHIKKIESELKIK